MSHLMNNYGRLPVSFDHGQGVWLWDKEGHKYLDALAGIAVNSVGHAHPRLVRAIADQASKLIHCSNYFNIDLQEKVAEKLVEHSGLEAVFFCNSGLEANECAIKIARKFGHAKSIEVPNIIVLKHAFHGRSIATLSATGNPSVREDFSPYTEGFILSMILIWTESVRSLKKIKMLSLSSLNRFSAKAASSLSIFPSSKAFVKSVTNTTS